MSLMQTPTRMTIATSSASDVQPIYARRSLSLISGQKSLLVLPQWFLDDDIGQHSADAPTKSVFDASEDVTNLMPNGFTRVYLASPTDAIPPPANFIKPGYSRQTSRPTHISSHRQSLKIDASQPICTQEPRIRQRQCAFRRRHVCRVETWRALTPQRLRASNRGDIHVCTSFGWGKCMVARRFSHIFILIRISGTRIRTAYFSANAHVALCNTKPQT